MRKVVFLSKSLSKNMRINVYIPRGYNLADRYPVLYLLHGYNDTEDKWMPILDLKQQADRLVDLGRIRPLIIVMPQIDNSFGLNTNTSTDRTDVLTIGSYEDYLWKDLIPYIDENYHTVETKDGRFVGGISMGGFAALHLAFLHPDLFSKVGGHSPALLKENWLFPTEELRHERDPITLASIRDLGNLQVYLDCGDRDSFRFYEGCGQLFETLQERKVTSEYHLNGGEHNDEYWNKNSEDYLLFYAGRTKS